MGLGLGLGVGVGVALLQAHRVALVVGDAIHCLGATFLLA